MFNNLAECFEAGLVTKGPGPVSLLGPAPVAIHDNRNMGRNVRCADHTGSDFKEFFFLFSNDLIDFADSEVGHVLNLGLCLALLVLGNLLVFQ